MNPDWQQQLRDAGAHIEDNLVRDFGDPAGELDAAQSRDVLADLSHLGVLEFNGDDAGKFLQGQLTCDVEAIGPGASSFGSYCTPKGRMLASFLLWRSGGGFRMALSREIAAAAQKRLKMYVLRSKVQIGDVSDAVALIGIAGPGAKDALAPLAAAVPQRTQDVQPLGDDGALICVPGGRYVAAVPVSAAPALWQTLAGALRPVGTACWEWLDIRSGLPLVTAKTQELFTPQMANIELLGGVSFTKGCYTGQEVVARTQHLGKVKRRMFIANIEAAGMAPAPGDDLYSDDIPGQASGTVVNAQAAPGGGYDLLAVVHLSSRESSAVHLRSADGPVLRFLDLPYSVS